MKKLFAILTIVALVFLLAACGEKTNTETIKIGSIQDLTGGASAAGIPNAWGAEHAIEVINENGGINGRMLELITYDCKNDTAEGVNCYRKLVDEDGVVAIIGPPLSNPASAWVELSEEDGIPIVGHFMDEVCTTNPETGEVYPYMFLAEPSCATQSNIMAKYAINTLGVKTVATLYNPSNAFAKAHEAPLVAYFESHNGTVVARETFSWTDTDYSAQAIKIVAANPDAVFLCDYIGQVTTAYDALRDAGYKGKIIGANTLAGAFCDLVKNEVYDVYFLQNYDLNNENLGNIYEITRLCMTEKGIDYPSANTGFGWDAVQVLVNAMKQCKDPTDGAEVITYLAKTEDVLLSGGVTITIDAATHRPNNMGMFIADYDETENLRILGFLYDN